MQDFGRVIDWRNDRRWAYVLFPIVLCHLSHSRVRTSLDLSGSIEFAKTDFTVTGHPRTPSTIESIGPCLCVIHFSSLELSLTLRPIFLASSGTAAPS